MMLKAICDHIEDLQPIGELLGEVTGRFSVRIQGTWRSQPDEDEDRHERRAPARRQHADDHEEPVGA